MKTCVHAMKVVDAHHDDLTLSIILLSPVSTATLPTLVNTPSDQRTTLLGHGQVSKMIQKKSIVERTTSDGDAVIVAAIYNPHDDITNDEARTIVATGLGVDDLDGVTVRNESVGESSHQKAQIAGGVHLAVNVKRGFTTFDVKTGAGPRQYAVVNWKSGPDMEVAVFDADTNAFLGMLDNTRDFTAVHEAYQVRMSNMVNMAFYMPSIGARRVFVSDESEVDLNKAEEIDPASVIDMDFALAYKGLGRDLFSLFEHDGEVEVSGNELAALAGASNTNLIRRGEKALVPEESDEVSVLLLDSLYE